MLRRARHDITGMRIRVTLGRETIASLPGFAATEPSTLDELDRLAGADR
jgi:hypothetical protein